MNNEKILLNFSDEIQELLNDNGIDIFEELKNQIPDIVRTDLQGILIEESNMTKDVTLVILASSAAIYALTQGIVSIINALGNNKKILVTEEELIPVMKSNGETVNDENGKPLLTWFSKHKLIESTVKNNSDSNLELKVNAKSLSFKLRSKNN